MSKGRDRTPGALPHPRYLCLPSSFGGRGDEETLTANHLRGARHQEVNPGQDWSPLAEPSPGGGCPAPGGVTGEEWAPVGATHPGLCLQAPMTRCEHFSTDKHSLDEECRQWCR